MGNLLLKLGCICIVLIAGNTSIAQEKKLNRAKEQYDKYEYIDAQDAYLKVVNKGYRSADLFKNLANSYYFNSQFEEASKWYEELVKSYPDDIEPEYYFRYAQTLKSTGRYDEADTYMTKFTELRASDQRAQLFQEEPDYLERIDFQSGRFEIKNLAINSPFTDFGAAFFGDMVVFSSSRDTLITKKYVHQWNEEAFLDLFKAEYNAADGELSQYEKFDKKINSKFHESTPVFANEGKTVYFTRNNYNGGKYKTDKTGTNKLKIYRSYKNAEGGWTTPQSLPFNSDEYSTAHPALSPDEKTLYFSSDRPGGEGQSDIYEVTINEDGSFGEPKNLGDRINTEGKDTFPFVDNKNDLYFASDGHIGLGGLDVFVTSLSPQSEEQELVVNIGKPINSPQDDFAFVLDNPSKKGFFSSNREGGKGKDDIYSFLQTEDLKNFCEITITGVITDKDSGDLLPGSKVSLVDSNNNIITSSIVGDDAVYTFEEVDCSKDFFIRAEKEQYNTAEELVQTPGKTQSLDRPISLENVLKSADIGDDLAKILALNIIYFDFDQSYIRKDAAVELAKVIEVMNQYPKMKVDVRSHTDSHGDDAYNLWLSEQRAKSTVAYMVKNGIAQDRLTGKGYGETQLVNDCGNGSNCTKEEYQLSRRSEFIIVK